MELMFLKFKESKNIPLFLYQQKTDCYITFL